MRRESGSNPERHTMKFKQLLEMVNGLQRHVTLLQGETKTLKKEVFQLKSQLAAIREKAKQNTVTKTPVAKNRYGGLASKKLTVKEHKSMFR